MDPNTFNLFSSLNPTEIFFLLLKLLYLAGFGLYIAFAIVVISQIRQMTNALNGLLELPLKLFGLVHLLVAIIAFLLALMLL